jgi:uncharacterized protein with GYD domain
MPAYVSLINWTEKGVNEVKDTVTRVKRIEQALQAVGGRKLGIWWTLGQYDAVFLFEAPDDITATRLLVSNAMQGYVRSATMRAFSEDEMTSIIQGMS